jgi:hypothetical protein
MAVDVAIIVGVCVAAIMAVDPAVIVGVGVVVNMAVGLAVGDSLSGGRGGGTCK